MQNTMRASLRGTPFSSDTVCKTRPEAGRRSPLVVRNDSALIVNTKGGGHAFLGLHLAKKLIADGHRVTILNDGDKTTVILGALFHFFADMGADGHGSPTATKIKSRSQCISAPG